MTSRRGRGEGSVFRRKDGLWCGEVVVGYDAHGRRKRRTVYGTKREVLDQLARLRTDVLAGTLTDPRRLGVAAFLERWLEDTARPAVRAATYQLYAIVIRRHLAPRLGGFQLARLSPAHVQSVLADLERTGSSPRLRQLVFDVLHHALRRAVEWNLLPRDPCAVVTRPRVPRREMRVLAPEQAQRFLDAAREDRLHALYAVLVGCGLRLGEALGLTWPDTDLGRGTVTVRRQLCEVNGKLSMQEPKTERARRTVDLPVFVADALRQHQERMQAEGHLLNDRLLVFVDTDGTPIHRSALRRQSFLPLLRRAGIPHIRLHDLRHTCATLHLRQGTHPSIVAHMLGHSRVSMTLDVYSHVLPTMGVEAARRMDALLRDRGS